MSEHEKAEGARWFPLQVSRDKTTAPHPLRIPWPVAEKAYCVYAGKYGRSQTLERLAERGGFSGSEMDMLYPAWREEISAIAAAKAEGERIGYERGKADGVREERELVEAVLEWDSGMRSGMSLGIAVARYRARRAAQSEPAEKEG